MSFRDLGNKFLTSTFKDFAKDITIQSLTTAQDGAGGFIDNWSTDTTAKAFVFPATGKEAVELGRLKTDQLYKFELLSVANLSTKMKIVYNAEDYQIRSIQDIAEGNQWSIVFAEKGVAQ